MKNYHAELLKIVPEIFAKGIFVELFNEMMVSAPKAILSAYQKVNQPEPPAKTVYMGVCLDEVVEFLSRGHGINLSLDHAELIATDLFNGYKIQAIKDLRAVAAIGLKESKDAIDDILCRFEKFRKNL